MQLDITWDLDMTRKQVNQFGTDILLKMIGVPSSDDLKDALFRSKNAIKENRKSAKINFAHKVDDALHTCTVRT